MGNRLCPRPLHQLKKEQGKCKCTMGQNRKKHRINYHPFIHFPTNEGVSERVSAAECASEASSAEQATEWAVRANKRTDERVAQYSNLYSWLFWPTVKRYFLQWNSIENMELSHMIDNKMTNVRTDHQNASDRLVPILPAWYISGSHTFCFVLLQYSEYRLPDYKKTRPYTQLLLSRAIGQGQ